MPALILFLCLVTLSFNLSATDPAPVTSFIDKTKTSITGYDANLKISFSSYLVDDGKTVLVDIQLGDKRITNRLDVTDPKKKTFDLKAVNIKTGKVTNLNADELRSLTMLGRGLGHPTSLAHDLLESTLGLVLRPHVKIS